MSYNDLLQLPMLNGVTIIGDKTLEAYGIVPISTAGISEIILECFGYLI